MSVGVSVRVNKVTQRQYELEVRNLIYGPYTKLVDLYKRFDQSYKSEAFLSTCVYVNTIIQDRIDFKGLNFVRS